jgi:hypothetical protein
MKRRCCDCCESCEGEGYELGSGGCGWQGNTRESGMHLQMPEMCRCGTDAIAHCPHTLLQVAAGVSWALRSAHQGAVRSCRYNCNCFWKA